MAEPTRHLPQLSRSRWLALLLIPALMASFIVLLRHKHICQCNHDTGGSTSEAPLKRQPPLTKIEPLSPLPTKRSTILPHGARVACWPSTGGIWIKHVPPVEMDFLLLSQVNDTERPAPQQLNYYAVCPVEEEGRYTPPPIAEEDLFCQKMRMIGADFWDLPEDQDSLKGVPIELAMEPIYRNHLGFRWSMGSGASVVNLTEARLYHGPSLRGYNDVKNMSERSTVVHELGGFRCRANMKKCEKMWCKQYPSHCRETDRLYNFGLVHNRWTMYDWRGARISLL